MGNKKIRIGSAFAGIGGFDLGISKAWPNAETVWQIEKNEFCRKILRKHWPNSILYEDITTIELDNLEPVDVILGGWPCQDISICGKQRGIYDGEKSNLFWKLLAICRYLRPRIVILENVDAVRRIGGLDVLGAFTDIGYNLEWTILSAREFGAPHLRRRFFAVAYSDSVRLQETRTELETTRIIKRRELDRTNRETYKSKLSNYWKKTPIPEPTLCSMDDGISERMARLKALGNAIVPACSEYVGRCILESGLLDDFITENK